MTGRSLGRDGEIEAFVVDRYLESLLARDPADAAGVPDGMERAARYLAESLPRYHPSFRFEEALAGRLAAVAGRIAGGEVVDLPVPAHRTATEARLGFDARGSLVRPVVIGGVVTSAALSLVGAVVAWRRTRTVHPMTRAARAIARGRLA